MTKELALKLILYAERHNETIYKNIDAMVLFNQEKVLNSFKENRVALRHFAGSTGYSYEDEGKHVLGKVFAGAFGSESAIVSPLIASGTHAIAIALFGLLRHGDTMLSVTSMPYDTLVPVIMGEGNGSLKDYGIKFDKVDFNKDGYLDMFAIKKALAAKPTMVFLQRSRGYAWRNSLSIAYIKKVVKLVKEITPSSLIVVDNCYGEFTSTSEPIQVGADIIVGSLIKNPGGGIAPTGGYICGKNSLIDKIANRLTAPGVGVEVGSYQSGYRDYFQGFFMAPHIVGEALKSSILFATLYEKLGFEVLSPKNGTMSDIICSIKFKNCKKVIKFSQAIQGASPVDSFAAPEPWDMPGYDSKVIMAAGSFVQGASIELSCDAPMREPYIVHLQGALNYAHARIAACATLQAME